MPIYCAAADTIVVLLFWLTLNEHLFPVEEMTDEAFKKTPKISRKHLKWHRHL